MNFVFVMNAATSSGKAERSLYQAIDNNIQSGFSLRHTRTLELLIDALTALRRQSKRELADDLRRGECAELATMVEFMVKKMGPWIDGYRWRITNHLIIRSDIDWAPNEPSMVVTASDLQPLFCMTFENLVTRKMPQEIVVWLEAKGLTAKQASGFPWIGWFLPDGSLVAIVAPLSEEGEV